MQIVLCALKNQRCVGEGQFRGAKKALVDFVTGTLDEKDSNTSVSIETGPSKKKTIFISLWRHFRSLSWSVSRNRSAARQL